MKETVNLKVVRFVAAVQSGKFRAQWLDMASPECRLVKSLEVDLASRMVLIGLEWATLEVPMENIACLERDLQPSTAQALAQDASKKTPR
jgi:hypothetical protein